MKNNKYLKELGYEWYDLPGNYDEALENDERLSDKAAAGLYNKEDEEGFCDREFWNLDHTLDLIIYSKLCYFREHCATMVTPYCFCYDENGNHLDNGNEEWLKTLDKIIEGLKLSVGLYHQHGYADDEEMERIYEARKLLVEYWGALWY